MKPLLFLLVVFGHLVTISHCYYKDGGHHYDDKSKFSHSKTMEVRQHKYGMKLNHQDTNKNLNKVNVIFTILFKYSLIIIIFLFRLQFQPSSVPNREDQVVADLIPGHGQSR